MYGIISKYINNKRNNRIPNAKKVIKEIEKTDTPV